MDIGVCSILRIDGLPGSLGQKTMGHYGWTD